jgi:hypothetical protein
MNIIYSTNDFLIHQDKKKQTIYSISTTNNTRQLGSLTHSLYNSIINTQLLQYSTIITNDNDNNNNNNKSRSIYFKASSIESFNDFKKKYNIKTKTKNLPYNLVLKIIYSLSKQIVYLLTSESKCFYKLDTSNIFVIDECRFIYLSCEDLKDIKDNNIQIYRPISKSEGYLSPELKNANTIPILVNYKTIFYSLGLFILDNMPRNEDINKEINKHVNEDIKDTKLYFFLKRCLDNEPEKRFLLYV